MFLGSSDESESSRNVTDDYEDQSSMETVYLDELPSETTTYYSRDYGTHSEEGTAL